MTETRRIFWNVIATYGRSVFALFCGIFSSRWVLMSLGAEDYGLFGVVGGLVVFISFLNNTLSAANSRFYSVAIGQARVVSKGAGVENCQRWFNTALSIHTVLPLCLMAIGYPLGVWAVRNYLNIPNARLESCVWVFRLTCLSCLVNMMSVPFGAMYRAKQLIAELTIYGYATTLINVCMLYYMVTHPSDWLVKYAALVSFLAIIPQIFIVVRAWLTFPECKIRKAYLFSIDKVRQVLSFAGWEMLGAVCQLLRVQGVAIVVNKAFGARVNAAMTLGNSVDANATSLSSSLVGAFQPAIANAYGEGDMEKMRKFAYRTCKFSALLQLVFIIPLVAELSYILELWLKEPPPYTGFLCVVALASHFFTSVTQGHYSACSACGKIKEYQVNMSFITMLTLPAVIVVVWAGGGVYAMGAVLVAAMCCLALRRVVYAGRIAGLSARYWLSKVFLPVSIVGGASFCVSWLPKIFMSSGIWRLTVCVALCEMVLLPATWLFVLDAQEKEFVLKKLRLGRR